jgi:hypothetical protein
MRLTAPFLIVMFSAALAHAEDSSIDRADLDAAAGRALFQNSPLAVSIVTRPSEPVAVPIPVVAQDRASRTIRVVYPGPYRR